MTNKLQAEFLVNTIFFDHCKAFQRTSITAELKKRPSIFTCDSEPDRLFWQ